MSRFFEGRVGERTFMAGGKQSRRKCVVLKARLSDQRAGSSITLSLKACHLKGCQRVEKRPLTPPGSGAGSVASCSTRASTSERCDGESLTNAFQSLKPCTVSLEGKPSVALTSEADVRFFISRLLAAISNDKNRSCRARKYAKEHTRGQGCVGLKREWNFRRGSICP